MFPTYHGEHLQRRIIGEEQFLVQILPEIEDCEKQDYLDLQIFSGFHDKYGRVAAIIGGNSFFLLLSEQ